MFDLDRLTFYVIILAQNGASVKKDSFCLNCLKMFDSPACMKSNYSVFNIERQLNYPG